MAGRRRKRRTTYTGQNPRAGANALKVSKPRPQAAEEGSLTASGARIEHGQMDAMRRLIQPWQSRSFAYYDLLGEIKYAAQFYARMLKPLELYVEEFDAVEEEWNRTDDVEAKAALERIQDPGGGRTGLLGTYGRLMFLAGECYLLVTLDDDGEEQWEMVSTDELRPQAGSFVRYMAPQLGATEYREAPDEAWEPLEKTAVAYRLWIKHPRFSQLADATMQGVLDLCEELVLLTQAVRARARSRAAGAGILFIDERISEAPPEPTGDEDPEEDIFLSDLTEAMTAPIVDEGAASSVVPIIVRVPDLGEGESVRDLVHHLPIVDPTQLYPETGLRTECIDRIAVGLDMPPEILKGLSQANHWTGWQISEDTWKGHGAPVAQELVDSLSSAFLRPELKSKGKTSEEARRFRIAYDASAVINHPDRGKDANEAYDRRAIGKKAYREAKGFTEDDAMTAEELAEAVGIAVRDGSLALTGVPSAKDTPTGGPAPPDDGEPPADGASTEKAPPEAPPEPVPDLTASNGHGAARIIGAADLAVMRAREAAGNRIRSLARTRDPEADRKIDGVRAGDVAATLGRECVRALNAPADLELVDAARSLIEDAIRLYGIDDAAVAKLIGDSVRQHAARTLYDLKPTPLPAGLTNYVKGVTALVKV